jgi:hypothetical protein
MKKTVYFRLEYYKDTDDLSYKYRNKLFINFLRKIKKLKYVFGNIKMIESDDKIEYICYTVHNKEEKTLKKIENIVRKNINTNIILSRRIKEIASNKESTEIYQNVNKIIKNSKESKNIYIDFAREVIKSVIERKKQIPEEQSLSILIDTKDYNNTQLISELITQYKMINIVTSNIKQFAGLEEEAEQNFEPISVLNNKRKSLRNAKYILNVDFSGEKIKEYSIDRIAVIFNIADTKIDKLMYFDGNIINNVKLIDNGEFELQDEYNIQREKWSEAVREKIEKNEYELIGNRGNVEIK